MLFSVFLIALCVCFVQVYVYASKTECIKNGSVPEQIRIALRGPNAVTISWKTYGMMNVSFFKNRYGINDTPYPQVEYGTNETLFHSNISNGTSTKYDTSKLGSWFHNCAVNVKPSTKYYYRILSSLCTKESKLYSFTSQPAIGNSNPINISIVGDLANTNPAINTIKAFAKTANETDFFLHVGDISYADDHQPFFGNSYEVAWNKFQNNIEVVTANNIYMTAPGNHEVTCVQYRDKWCITDNSKKHRNFTAYLNRFRMPGDESKGYKNLWYSFDYGPAHFVIINTETDFPRAPAGPHTHLNGGNFAPNGTQLRWLKDDLDAANGNRKNVPWIIVAGHRPFFGSLPKYPPFWTHSDNCDSCRSAFAEIIFNSRADFYFCGHAHWYERLFPVDRNGQPLAKNYIRQDGPIYVTTGAGGAPEGVQKVKVAANASAKILSKHGYVQLEIINSSHCKLNFYSSDDNTILDSIKIERVRYA